MPRYVTLYPLAPWLMDLKDLRPQGKPEIKIERAEIERVDGLIIRGLPEGDAVLAIHSIRGNGTDGGTITAAVSSGPLRFNTPRLIVEQSDGASGDD